MRGLEDFGAGFEGADEARDGPFGDFAQEGFEQSQPVGRVVKLINPVLRGWVNYFRAGHSSECFGFVKDWVEKKIRRHMLRARKRQGFGWTRWSRDWLYETLGLFNGYRAVRSAPKVAPAG